MNTLKNAFKRKEAAPANDGLFAGGSSTAFRRKVQCKEEDFELLVTLGTGTFGRVKLAKFKRAEEVSHATSYYALKILKKAEILRLKQLAHIKNEIVLLAMIENPFIVNMVNHFQDEKRLTMVLEFVPGGELFTYLRNEGRLGNDEARFFAAQICLAFGYLHTKNIAYRDLKPENLLICSDGYLKVADFGFAKIVEQRTWTLCGTPEYLAPELIQSKGHGKPVDWWAFGVLVYEMLAGYPPFYDENPFGIYQRIIAGVVEYPTHIDSKVVAMLKKLLTADLSKRIGCLKGGPSDVQKCKWFAKTDWKGLYDHSVQAYYLPTIENEADTANFDAYPNTPPDGDSELEPKDAAAFAEFDTIGFRGINLENSAAALVQEAKVAE